MGGGSDLGLALSHPGEVAGREAVCGEEDCQTRHLWSLEWVVLPALSNSLAPQAGGGHGEKVLCDSAHWTELPVSRSHRLLQFLFSHYSLIFSI